ncbi:MAG: hypothetical protein Q9204_006918 [Flavoplaca sp. TL-2023a]
MDFRYNEPLATIARHRIAFEKSMTNLGRPGKSDRRERTADIERLSKPGPIDVEDLVDLKPWDLKKIYDARKKHQEEVRSKEREHADANPVWDGKYVPKDPFSY